MLNTLAPTTSYKEEIIRGSGHQQQKVLFRFFFRYCHVDHD